MKTLEQKCETVLSRHAKSFRWAAVFLPSSTRRDAALAYTFCRLVDDTVDEASSVDEARAKLAHLEAMVRGRVKANQLVGAYVSMCERRSIGLEPACDLLRGVRSDLAEVRVTGAEELDEYCYRVAGTVGLMMCGVLLVSSSRAHRHAIDLGKAMQLTNICRDVLEDARRGRVYLPLTDLARRGLTQGAVIALAQGQLGDDSKRVRDGVARVVRGLLERAELLYESGSHGLHFIPGRARLAILVASRVYREIGRRLIRQRGADPFEGRVVVPMWRKLFLTGTAVVRYLAPKRRTAGLLKAARLWGEP